jgi:hypothetical protein
MAKDKKTRKQEVQHIRPMWGLLCSMSSIDQQKNNISLFNVIHQFNLPSALFDQQKKEKKLILFPYPFEVVLCWKRILDLNISGEEIPADLKLKLIDSENKVLQETLAPLKFPQNTKTLRYRVEMPGILASTPGSYIYQVELKLPDWKNFKKELEIPFEIAEKANQNK